MLGVATILMAAVFAMPVGAASAYADFRFQMQWQQGEAVTPNFWGPLSTARDGQQEPYKEAQGGTRLVQYFDKGRMEITNGIVTNGLLASEILRGQLQLGDATFQPKPLPSIPLAGDLDSPGPTWAQLAARVQALCGSAVRQPTGYVQTLITVSGEITVTNAGPTEPAMYTAYDEPTQHNVPRAFAEYRNKAGLLTIGYALCEPVNVEVRVAGVQRRLHFQVFERRVLTYNAANPDAFKVEMGNIGQHYYRWRYST
jgi:hypothetical protein